MIVRLGVEPATCRWPWRLQVRPFLSSRCPPRRDPQERGTAHAPACVITAAPDAGVPLRDVQEAASDADPRTTMRSHRARASPDRHATYIVAAFIAGAAR